MDDIPAEVYVVHYRTLKQIAVDHAEIPADLDIGPFEKVGVWYYGKTGVGKTRLAIKDYGDDLYRKMANNKWWDSYQGESNVLLDDLDKSHHYMGYYLKIWTDRYAFLAEVKGSSRPIRPKKIIVTSNYHPRDIWDDTTTLDPILRRFRVVNVVTVFEELGLTHTDERLVADFS